MGFSAIAYTKWCVNYLELTDKEWLSYVNGCGDSLLCRIQFDVLFLELLSTVEQVEFQDWEASFFVL